MSQPPKRRPSSKPEPPSDLSTVSQWDEALRAFFAECRRKNLSASTLQNYEWYLKGLRARQFLEDHGITSPADFNDGLLERFEVELFEAGLASGTVATFHRVFKNFARFCLDTGRWGVSKHVLNLKAPKEETRQPETFRPEELARLLKAASYERDRVIIELYVRTGLRLTELARLELEDIVDSPDGAYLRVRQGKGRKDRIVPLDTPGCQMSRKLQRYVERVRPSTTAHRALFLSIRKELEVRDPVTGAKALDYAPVKARAIQIMFRRLWFETGIHAHAHKARHTFATEALRAGVDPLALKRALGHTTLRMVDRYVQYNGQDLLRAWAKRSD